MKITSFYVKEAKERCNMNVLANLVFEITEKFVSYNNDLKKGNFLALRKDVDQIFLKYEKYIKNSLNLINSEIYGMNIEIVGLTSNYLFPAALYNNDFRLQLLKELNNFLKDHHSPEKVFEFFSKRIKATIGVKRGGFTKETLEILQYYLKTYPIILDNTLDPYINFLHSNKVRYPEITEFKLKNRFPFVQKYSTTYPLASGKYFSLASILLENEEIQNFEELRGNLLGMIYNDEQKRKYLLLRISAVDTKNYRDRLISRISFFENLDLFYTHNKSQRLKNKVNDLWFLYSDYKDHTFINSAIDYTISYSQKYTENRIDYGADELINIFNTRRIPPFFHLHPELKKWIFYRNRLATIYTSVNYFIHIYDISKKNLERFRELFDQLLKNTFSNGYIIHYKSGILISTRAFKEDFEKVKLNFKEFIWFFKLECNVYENLNFIPFSFYHLPNSRYYCNEINQWKFPVFEEKPVKEYFDHLAINYRQEMKRLEDASFKAKVDQTLERLTGEIAEIKEQQKKSNWENN